MFSVTIGLKNTWIHNHFSNKVLTTRTIIEIPHAAKKQNLNNGT
jgi:hypothetical protein